VKGWPWKFVFTLIIAAMINVNNYYYLLFYFKRISDENEFSVLRVWLGIMLEELGDRNWYSVNKQSDIQAVYTNAHGLHYADNRLSPFTVAVPYSFRVSGWIFRNLNHLIIFEFADHVIIQVEYVNNFKTNYFHKKNISFPS